MKLISYEDGEEIKSMMVQDGDAPECKRNLEEKGFQIISEEKV